MFELSELFNLKQVKQTLLLQWFHFAPVGVSPLGVARSHTRFFFGFFLQMQTSVYEALKSANFPKRAARCKHQGVKKLDCTERRELLTRLRNKSESSETQTLSAPVLRREEEKKKPSQCVGQPDMCFQQDPGSQQRRHSGFFFFFFIRGILGRRPSEAESGATRCV